MPSRANIKTFQQLPNVGPAIEKCFVVLGLASPFELIGQDPYKLYDSLCAIENKRYDPVLLTSLFPRLSIWKGAKLENGGIIPLSVRLISPLSNLNSG